MKGYKILSRDLKAKYGNGMQYNVGKTYETEGRLEACKNGFHFCTSLEETLIWYNTFKGNKLFEIDTLGSEVKELDRKNVCRKIKLIREISEKEIKDYFKKNLDKIINNKSWLIRAEVARQGFGLDVLVNDEDWVVREEVAKKGFGLDILIKDENWVVRAEVARQRFGLDILINDGDWLVRIEVARQGYGLDKLINDEHWEVRMEVAKQGFGLNKLINDEDEDVRRIAQYHIQNK